MTVGNTECWRDFCYVFKCIFCYPLSHQQLKENVPTDTWCEVRLRGRLSLEHRFACRRVPGDSALGTRACGNGQRVEAGAQHSRHTGFSPVRRSSRDGLALQNCSELGQRAWATQEGLDLGLGRLPDWTCCREDLARSQDGLVADAVNSWEEEGFSLKRLDGVPSSTAVRNSNSFKCNRNPFWNYPAF